MDLNEIPTTHSCADEGMIYHFSESLDQQFCSNKAWTSIDKENYLRKLFIKSILNIYLYQALHF